MIYGTTYSLKVGMTTKEVQANFGLPDSTAVRQWGKDTPKPWPVLIYEYRINYLPGHGYMGYINKFYFDMSYNPPLLHSWDIEYTYPERKN